MGSANERFQLDKIIKLERELADTEDALRFMSNQYSLKVDEYLAAKDLADSRLARVRELEAELNEIELDRDEELWGCSCPACGGE